jgi:phage-related protein
MTYPTFSPPFNPIEPCTETRSTRYIQANFGDGYRQWTPDGSEIESSDVTLTFEPLSVAQYQTMDSFFSANVGSPILYALPTDGVGRSWVVTSYTPTRQGTFYSVQVTLAPAT